jgi:6-pyruvoyltetrahydropterin/6-carboxytetrahydropterin synthase
MDFGGLKPLKAHLDYMFDHTLLLNHDDPLIPLFRELEEKKGCDLRLLPNVGMEGTAQYLHEWVNNFLNETTKDRVRCVQVEVRENDKNSGIYRSSFVGAR